MKYYNHDDFLISNTKGCILHRPENLQKLVKCCTNLWNMLGYSWVMLNIYYIKNKHRKILL